MNYGLYLSASGALTNLHRMDALAGNLANAETTGYKPMTPATRERSAARIEDGLFSLPSSTMMERLGSGAMLMPNRLSLPQGALETTGRPLDVALQGQGFLVLQSGQGADSESLRLTRDGRLTTDSRGRLVHAGSGLPVLDTANKPITLDPGAQVRIDGSGTIRQNGAAVATLQVAAVAEPARLRPEGSGLYRADARIMAARRPAAAAVAQGSVERSAVDAVRTMLDLSSAERAVQSNLRMVSLYDQLMERAVAMGRVA